jgi:hypothetical protein
MPDGAGNGIRMKRYSLTFRTTEKSAPSDELRNAVDDVLLRMHPKYSYRLGRWAASESGRLSVEIESEANKESLSERLRKIEQTLPVVLESVAWGWAEDGGPESEASPGPLDWGKDPLARIDPLPLPTAFLPTNQHLVYRFILFAVLTLTLILSFPVRFVLGRILLMELVWVGFYAVWLFTLPEIPFDMRPLLEKIECAPEELVLSFLFPRRTVRLPWESIRELTAGFSGCTLRGEGKPVRFFLQRKGGFREKDVILKTIVQRASLRFVEGNPLQSVYRRSDES